MAFFKTILSLVKRRSTSWLVKGQKHAFSAPPPQLAASSRYVMVQVAITKSDWSTFNVINRSFIQLPSVYFFAGASLFQAFSMGSFLDLACHISTLELNNQSTLFFKNKKALLKWISLRFWLTKWRQCVLTCLQFHYNLMGFNIGRLYVCMPACQFFVRVYVCVRSEGCCKRWRAAT